MNEAKAMGRWYDVYAYRIGGPDSRKVGLLFTDITDRKRAEAATRFRSEQLRRLAEIATRLNSALDITSITGVVTEEAHALIGAHQAVTSFTTDLNWGQAINVVLLSDKYARWRGYEEKPDGSGIYSLLGVGANQTAIVVQRRRAEEETQEQRERLRVTLASIGDAVLTTDTEGRVTSMTTLASNRDRS